jgi:hypothetical protein
VHKPHLKNYRIKTILKRCANCSYRTVELDYSEEVHKPLNYSEEVCKLFLQDCGIKTILRRCTSSS